MALRLNGSNTGYVELDVPADAGSHTLTLPDGGGSSGQYLQTNGSGVLSWAASTEYQGPAFKAYKSGTSTTSFTASTETKIILDAETFDTDGCFDSSTNYRFTPTKAGYYFIEGTVFTNWSGSQYSNVRVSINKNGTQTVRHQWNGSSGTANYGTKSAFGLVYLNGSTDYVELYHWSDASGPLYSQGELYTFMQGFWVHD